jgi:tetratricopeptide (TPR) repeat protein
MFMRLIPIRHALFVLTAMGLVWPVSRATAEIPNEVEPEYSKAVLDYNAQNFERALRQLVDIEKKAPKSTEIQELKAITLRALKREKDAANVYRELLQMKTKDGKDKKEIAPYAFELGVIRYNEKNWKQAEQYLQFSARHGFNVEVSKFYLGLVQIQTQEWEKADQNLSSVIKGDVDDLKPAAHYYSSQVHFKLGYPSDGFGNLLEAKRKAQKQIARPDVQPATKRMAEQVKQAADASLAPFDKTQFFGNFSLMLGYDSNVLLVPSEGSGPDTASGKTTSKALVSASAGYASSPLAMIQYVPTIRFNLNKNSNGESSTGEFADTTLSLYLTKDALAPVSYGLKTEGTLVFQNQTDATTTEKKYALFDSMITLAPYLKWDVSKRWSLGAEVGYRITNYPSDDTVSASLKRSGTTPFVRLTAQNRANRKYLNPTFAIRAESTATDGTEYDSRLYGIQFINTMRFKKVDFSQVLGLDRTNYPNSSTLRKDTLVSFAVLGSKKIGPRWALIASADVTKNTSTDDTSYSYDRYTFNAGVGYAF